jgi:hypothetical protein
MTTSDACPFGKGIFAARSLAGITGGRDFVPAEHHRML